MLFWILGEVELSTSKPPILALVILDLGFLSEYPTSANSYAFYNKFGDLEGLDNGSPTLKMNEFLFLSKF